MITLHDPLPVVGEVRRFEKITCMGIPSFKVVGVYLTTEGEATIRAVPHPNPARPPEASTCSFTAVEWNSGKIA